MEENDHTFDLYKVKKFLTENKFHECLVLNALNLKSEKHFKNPVQKDH